MTVVDTCVLSSLAKIERLDLLRNLSQKELQYANKLKTDYGLIIADSECIAIAKMRREILLGDDKYPGKIAIREGVEHVYDLLTFLEACIVKRMIQKAELIEIIHLPNY